MDALNDPRIKLIPLPKWVSALQRPNTEAQELALRVICEAALQEDKVEELYQAGAIEQVVKLLVSEHEMIATHACWFVTNMCSDRDDIREAFVRAGVLEKFPIILQSESSLVLEKALWSITNLALSDKVRKVMGAKGFIPMLVKTLNLAFEIDERKLALQPIINLLLEDYHKEFISLGGLPIVLAMLRSEDVGAINSALTVLFLICITQGDIRYHLVGQHGVLEPLSHILENIPNQKTQTLALQVLTNLSVSDANELPIARSGVLLSVVDLLASKSEEIQSSAAMLLANLALNSAIRENIKLYGWAQPIMKLVQSPNPVVQLHSLRFALNISLDGYSRKLIIDASGESILKSLLSSFGPDDDRADLCASTLENLEVPISKEVLDQFKVEVTEVEVVEPSLSRSGSSGMLAVSTTIDVAPKMQRTDSGNIRPVVVASVSQPAIAGGSTDQAAASQPMRVRKATIRFDPAEAPLYARRERVATELLQTERTYVHSLKTIREGFLIPLRQAAANGKPILSPEEIHKLFSVTEILFSIHSKLLAKIEPRMQTWKWDTCLADIFIEMGETLKAYKPYINNYDSAVQFFSTEATKRKAWIAFMKEAMVKFPELAGAGLSHFLIQPIQRMPRYIMLLDQLIKYTPPHHIDHGNMTKALDKMKQITEYLNEAKRSAESANKLVDVELKLTGLTQSLMAPGRRFVKEGTAIEDRKGGSRSLNIILCSDLILLSAVMKRAARGSSVKGKQFKVVKWLPFYDILMVEKDGDDKSSKLKMTCRADAEWDGLCFFSFASPEERNEWYQAITNAISAEKTALAERREATHAAIRRGVSVDDISSRSPSRSSSFGMSITPSSSPPSASPTPTPSSTPVPQTDAVSALPDSGTSPITIPQRSSSPSVSTLVGTPPPAASPQPVLSPDDQMQQMQLQMQQMMSMFQPTSDGGMMNATVQQMPDGTFALVVPQPDGTKVTMPVQTMPQ